MDLIPKFNSKARVSVLDKGLPKAKSEVWLKTDLIWHLIEFNFKPQINVSAFALLFSEMVQYCQNRVYTVPELQNRFVIQSLVNVIKIKIHFYAIDCQNWVTELAKEF